MHLLHCSVIYRFHQCIFNRKHYIKQTCRTKESTHHDRVAYYADSFQQTSYCISRDLWIQSVTNYISCIVSIGMTTLSIESVCISIKWWNLQSALVNKFGNLHGKYGYRLFSAITRVSTYTFFDYNMMERILEETGLGNISPSESLRIRLVRWAEIRKRLLQIRKTCSEEILEKLLKGVYFNTCFPYQCGQKSLSAAK